MKEVLISSETSILTRVTWRYIPEDRFFIVIAQVQVPYFNEITSFCISFLTPDARSCCIIWLCSIADGYSLASHCSCSLLSRSAPIHRHICGAACSLTLSPFCCKGTLCLVRLQHQQPPQEVCPDSSHSSRREATNIHATLHAAIIHSLQHARNNLEESFRYNSLQYPLSAVMLCFFKNNSVILSF
jgi:hypothetical protein